MRLLELTLDSAVENVALDEALLDACEREEGERASRSGDSSDRDDGHFEALRIWEPNSPVVVIGRGSRLGDEVRLDYCRERWIPIVRRSSGGLAVVAGRGCLMYAVALSYARRPQLHSLDEAHRLVLDGLATALARIAPQVARRGTSDLALGDRKFSGNSVRCKRSHLLYHGTLLYDFPLEIIGHCLAPPWRAPDYRGNRAHDEFVVNFPASRAALRDALLNIWQPTAVMQAPWAELESLMASKYRRPEWHELGAVK